MSDEAPQLLLRNVTYAVNGRKILDSVSWTVTKGEHWAILGPNGAGKTTLLKIVCGYLWPNEGGEIHRNGHMEADLRELRRSIGWVTSSLADDIPRREPVLDTVLSGKFAQLGLWQSFWEPATPDDVQRARGHLRELNCETLAERPFGTLSQGEQQRVLICRARMAKPYLIILDEPCAGMDHGAREQFLSSLLSIANNRSHPAMVYVTHHVEEILPVFGKTLILKEGHVMASGQTGDLLTPATMKQLYGISIQLVKKHGRYWPIPE